MCRSSACWRYLFPLGVASHCCNCPGRITWNIIVVLASAWKTCCKQCCRLCSEICEIHSKRLDAIRGGAPLIGSMCMICEFHTDYWMLFAGYMTRIKEYIDVAKLPCFRIRRCQVSIVSVATFIEIISSEPAKADNPCSSFRWHHQLFFQILPNNHLIWVSLQVTEDTVWLHCRNFDVMWDVVIWNDCSMSPANMPLRTVFV